MMRAFAAHGLGVGLGYAQPAPRVSHDGTPFVLRKIVDAGTEALVLARLKTAPEPPALPESRRFLTSLFVTKSQGFPKPL